jgi:hypothetical protein
MLYKYLSVNSLSFKSILEKQEVYFAAPSELNDPFEFKPQYLFPSKTKLKQHLLKRGAKRKNLKALIPRAIEDLQYNKQSTKLGMEMLNENSGVLCMTPHHDNLLMWSHYGDSHKGVCIGFDINLPFDNIFGNGYEVEYKDEYPTICLTEIDMMLAAHMEGSNLDKYDNIITQHAFTKAKTWNYEDEIRFLRDNSIYDTKIMDFPSTKLTEMILGTSISKENENIVLSLMKNNFPHAKIKRSKLSSKEYKLEIEEILC